ncbi:TonB-dependent receptor [Desertivirga arenae]|uniref:TonB-dependent receptor n=1 Tax=Desertivirga arenae TaxID=2810309 RepID=UPI001A978A71|nr:TonB-dependent receptor [Pedobacter sp. SYSU D00823]
MRKYLLFSLFLLLGVNSVFSQITTSTLTGLVKDEKGDPLVGASVKATHLPTGTAVGTAARADGRFLIANLRAGGPYTIEVAFIGFAPKKFQNIYLKLSEPLVLNVTLNETGTQLSEVVISANGNSILNADRSGSTTNISRQQIQALPTITRSVNDITRLTPQAGGPNGSVAGGSYRSNNFTVDGANFNNQFGIGQNVPASGSPISLDALDEISINVTPYDIRQTGFTGAAINAVTRSGTNNFSGTAFYLGRGDEQQGGKVNGSRIAKQNYEQTQYGFSIGGPILKNKLFFFVNAEFNDITQPGPNKIAATPEVPFGPTNTNVARPTAVFLDEVRSYLINNYQYDPGAYQGYQNESNNDKFLARLDWNIAPNHRFNIRYNQVESKTPRPLSSSTTNSGVTYGSAVNRLSNQALHFANSAYFQEENLYSVSGELNSSLFAGRVTNTLRGTWTHQNDPRSSGGGVFPLVDILSAGNPITTFGYEPFTYGNLRDVQTYSVNDDLSMVLGKHSLLGGFQAEFSKTKNGFQRYATGFYTFASWEDFKNGADPTNYALTYSLTPDGSQAFPTFKFAQYSFYVQDQYSVNERLKLTGGIRLELPTYPDVEEMKTHPLVAGLTYANDEKINTGSMPKTSLMFSPRIGFNWDIKGDRSLQLRGGSGIFTGRIPYVWIVSQSGDSGMLQYLQTYSTPQDIAAAGIKFSPDVTKYIPVNKAAAGTTIPSSISAMAKDLKFPQSWKSSLALDFKLPFGVVGTVEGIYQKDLNAVYARNANLVDPTAMAITGYPDNREIYPSGAARYINRLDAQGRLTASGTGSADAIVMDNKKGGHYWSVTGQLNKQFSKGLSATAAYTHSEAKNYGDLGGDQIANLWSYPYIIGNSNNPTLSYTSNVIPDRVIASVTYRKEFLRHLATSFSLFYEGSIQGRYSYYYSSDFNRDNQTNDLIYVPNDPSEITFANIPANTNGYSKAYTPQEQSDIFFAYIEQDDYLKTRKGKYAERNGAKLPWRNQVDVRFAQDLFANVGKSKNSLQFTIDIFNFGNLLNSKWGNVDFVNNQAILVPQNVSSLSPTGSVKPTFRLANAQGDIVRNTYSTNQTISSTYYLQMGLRYRFN